MALLLLPLANEINFIKFVAFVMTKKRSFASSPKYE